MINNFMRETKWVLGDMILLSVQILPLQFHLLLQMLYAWDQSHTNNASVTSTFISLEWNSNSVMYLMSNFIVEITSLGEVLHYTTPNTTIQLPVVYNQEYDIKVLATNCIGNSSSANLSLSISKQINYHDIEN